MDKFVLWFLRLFPQFREAVGWRGLYDVATASNIRFKDGMDEQSVRAEQWCKEAESTAKIAKSLRDEIASLKTQNQLLQDRLESALADKSHLWEMVGTSLDSERQSLRMMANESYKQKWGTTPFPEEWAPPDKLTRDPNASREALGRQTTMVSEMVRRQTMQSLEHILATQQGQQ